MTGTNEQREKPLCGTFPDWNVWCIGGAVWVSPAVPGWVFMSKTNGYKAPPPPARTKGGGAHLLRLVFSPPGFPSIADPPPASFNGGHPGGSVSLFPTGDS